MFQLSLGRRQREKINNIICLQAHYLWYPRGNISSFIIESSCYPPAVNAGWFTDSLG